MYGASGLGCLYEDVSEQASDSTFDAVVAAGITYVDTAPWYGAGLSESRVGNYFANTPLEGLKISTKCGRIIKAVAEVDLENPRIDKGYFEGFKTEKYHSNVPYHIYDREGILESFRQSCERLQVDKIHCLRLHDAENETRWSEATEKGGVEAMLELRANGKIKEISLGFNSSEYLLKFIRKYPAGTFDNIMMAGCFNLIDQDGLELLQECQARGIKVTNVGIFASGILVGGKTYKYGPVPPEVESKVKAWQALADKHGITLGQLSMNFALLPDCVEAVAFGCKSPNRVQGNIDMLGKQVPSGLWQEAKDAGLIVAELPLPGSSESNKRQRV